MERIETVLHYWFGNAEATVLPSEYRSWVWFSGDHSLDADIQQKFQDDLLQAMSGGYNHWQQTPRGCLALILLLDQFSRHIYRRTPQAFAQDSQALQVCIKGIESSYDHQLSLIERAFFYFPLMHTENIDLQVLSVRAYQILYTIAFAETQPLFHRFLSYAVRHHDHIVRFGRFLYRNEILGRSSTKAEQIFLLGSDAKFAE